MAKSNEKRNMIIAAIAGLVFSILLLVGLNLYGQLGGDKNSEETIEVEE